MAICPAGRFWLKAAADVVSRLAAGYLVSMKERGLSTTDLDAAVDWVGTEFGVEYAGPAAIVASLAGHPEGHRILARQVKAKNPTFEQRSNFLGPDLFPQ